MKLLSSIIVLLAGISAISSTVLSDVGSSVAKPGRINKRSPFTDQPAQIPISYHFTSIGDYGVELTINNHDKRPAYILTWNTIFEVPMPATRSISVTPNSQGSIAPERYLGNVYIDHRKVLASSFLKVPPVDDQGRGVRWYFDLRNDFFIQRGGSYQVKVQQQFRGFVAEDWDFERLFAGSGLLARSDIATLPLATPLDVTLTMNLRSSTDGAASSGSKRSSPSARKDKRVAPSVITRDVPNTKCTWEQGWKVSDARVGVNQLAQVAGHLKDDPTWTQYYNGPQAIRDALDRAYKNIELYKVRNSYGVLESCPTPAESLTVTGRYDGDKRVPWCSPDRAAFLVQHRGSTSSILGFCDLFFTLPELRKCDAPNLANNNMVDRTGVFLRALGNVPNIASDRQVLNRDPWSDYCYGWGCVTDAARFRPNPRWDRSSPAAGASDFTYGLPDNILDTFEQYAYALREKTCTDKDRNGEIPMYCKIRNGCRAGLLCIHKYVENMQVLMGATMDLVGTCTGGGS
ncbi:MAG: hypothetical protein M1836_005209 [Candelina mexicana]|nr:MAG: hypothetical protein M1836_005209 [Candelina mexicana]